jgi:hypothetical protein
LPDSNAFAIVAFSDSANCGFVSMVTTPEDVIVERSSIIPEKGPPVAILGSFSSSKIHTTK